jgi:hypothetical protein
MLCLPGMTFLAGMVERESRFGTWFVVDRGLVDPTISADRSRNYTKYYAFCDLPVKRDIPYSFVASLPCVSVTGLCERFPEIAEDGVPREKEDIEDELTISRFWSCFSFIPLLSHNMQGKSSPSFPGGS